MCIRGGGGGGGGVECYPIVHVVPLPVVAANAPPALAFVVRRRAPIRAAPNSYTSVWQEIRAFYPSILNSSMLVHTTLPFVPVMLTIPSLGLSIPDKL